MLLRVCRRTAASGLLHLPCLYFFGFAHVLIALTPWQRTRGDASAKKSATAGGDATSARKRTHADIISREGGASGSSDSCVGDLMRTKSHARSWVSLRHNLHEALVESGEKGFERMQSLPKMSELVTTMKDNVSLCSYSCR